PVHRHRLRGVLDAAERGQRAADAQRIRAVAMGAARAAYRRLVPVEHAVEQAHRARVRDALRDVRFRQHGLTATSIRLAAPYSSTTVPEALHASAARSGRLRAAGTPARIVSSASRSIFIASAELGP